MQQKMLFFSISRLLIFQRASLLFLSNFQGGRFIPHPIESYKKGDSFLSEHISSLQSSEEEYAVFTSICYRG